MYPPSTITSVTLSYPCSIGPRCALSLCAVSSSALYGVRVSRMGARLARFGTRMTVWSLTPSRMRIIAVRFT